MVRITVDFFFANAMVYLMLFMGANTSRVLYQEDNNTVISDPKVSQISNEKNVSQVFEDWMHKYNRVYSSHEEKDRRFAAFQKTYEFVENYKKGNITATTFEINEFADMINTGLSADTSSSFFRTNDKNDYDYDDDDDDDDYYGGDKTCESVDWSAYMTPVKDQGPCGSCWAHAALSTMEAVTAMKYGKSYVFPLSVQQLVDCDTRSSGCAHGEPDYAFMYIIENEGITTEENYPYTMINGTCNIDKANYHDYFIDSYAYVYPRTEAALAKAVCKHPVVVEIETDNPFAAYKGGIFSGYCGKKSNHVVTLVGFGTDENGVKYWKIQNSHGERWGERGFMRMIRDSSRRKIGHCGIARRAVYPKILP